MTDLTALSADEVHKFVEDNLPPGFVDKPKQPDKRRICLAILAYDGRIDARTMMCLMQAVMQCAAQGWGVTYILREADSMVARGRSYLASQFLENPESANCTDLVFIDTDLTWDGDEFLRLCNHPVDVVGGAYPFKDESGDFPLRWPADGLMEENGLWQVQAVTPGFFRVTRKALEKIAREMPWLEFKDRANAKGQRSWMFFDNLQRPTGVYDEGYVFCEHWRSVGGKVWLDPDLNLTHTGRKSYNHGTLRGWLDRKSQTFERLESEFPGVPPLKLMKKVMGEDIDLTQEKVANDLSGVSALQANGDRQSIRSGGGPELHQMGGMGVDPVGAVRKSRVGRPDKVGVNEAHNQHRDTQPAGTAGHDGQPDAAEHQAAGHDADDLGGRRRRGRAQGPRKPAEGPAPAHIGEATGGLKGREVRPRLNGGAG